MKTLIADFDDSVNSIKNVTDIFLTNFLNGSSLETLDLYNLYGVYTNLYFLGSNDTTYRKCWNFRGKFLSEIEVLELEKKKKYDDYLNKLKIVEEQLPRNR